jgi:hypothetical protein
MKTIRVSVLVALLACSVHAGVMQSGVVDPPPPPPATNAMQEPVSQNPQITVSPITEIVVLLQSLLTLF